MPSFDVVSEFEIFEVRNAVDQANREVETRFDFKGSDAKFVFEDDVILMTTKSDFQLNQMLDVLRQKMAKRGIDVGCMDPQSVDKSLHEARQKIVMKKGIDTLLAKRLVKTIKASKLKVQTAIQGEKLRITGKKRDDLQAAISLLKETDTEIPLQYENFRD